MYAISDEMNNQDSINLQVKIITFHFQGWINFDIIKISSSL